MPTYAELFRSLCDLIAMAEPDNRDDLEEDRETFERAERVAAAVRAASEPCPQCTSAEQLCEACGGHGVVPKAEPLKIVVSCNGGCVTAVYCTNGSATAEVVDFDEFETGEGQGDDDRDPDEVLDEATSGMSCIY